MAQGLSQRSSCRLVGLSRRGLCLEPVPDQNAALREALRKVWRPNMGYRMAWGFLREEFAPLNLKRVHRIWKQERLGRMKRYRKKRTGNPVPLAAEHPNHVWCVDFCFDWTENRTKLKVLSVKDEFTKELLALEAAPRFRSRQVQEVLGRLIQERGAPAFLRSDNGPEFLSRTLAVFLSQAGSQSRFIAPGSPWQNGHAESFVSRLRAELLDVELFVNLADAEVKLAVYRRYYNEQRPHSSLGYVPPAEAAAQFADSGRATPSLRPQIAMSSSEGSLTF